MPAPSDCKGLEDRGYVFANVDVEGVLVKVEFIEHQAPVTNAREVLQAVVLALDIIRVKASLPISELDTMIDRWGMLVTELLYCRHSAAPLVEDQERAFGHVGVDDLLDFLRLLQKTNKV